MLKTFLPSLCTVDLASVIVDTNVVKRGEDSGLKRIFAYKPQSDGSPLEFGYFLVMTNDDRSARWDVIVTTMCSCAGDANINRQLIPQFANICTHTLIIFPRQPMISPEVMQELLSVRRVLHYLPESASTEKGWTEHEQHLFWVALAQYPQGPWTMIAEVIGTKSARQVMTHGQKLRQKLKRWNERLRSNPTASMLMDTGRVNVSTSVDLSVSAGISVEAMSTTTDASISGNFQSHEPLVHGSELSAGLMTDGASIVEMDEFHLTNANTNMPSSHFHPNASAVHPNLSRDTASVVELMLSESSVDVQVTDISDAPEILPQDLLDDLLEILSDDDLNELGNHQRPGMP